ncbi:vesicle transport protein SFT2A isoform X4 [Aquarana catesbeiana]|uniref:vesicle transport protein SFT2A isoform X4 n=1 Tax=Aquarana catesbeiana TaxID=8400 RepID=UPI003CCA1F1B
MDKLRRVLNGHEDEERGLTTQDCHQLQKGFGFNIAKFWHTCEVVCSILYIGNCIFNSRECTTVGSWCWNKTFCCILYTRKCCCLNQLCLICTLCAVFWVQHLLHSICKGSKDSEDTPHPRRPQTPHLWKKVKYPQPKQSRRRKKMWWRLAPQQVIVMLGIEILSHLKVPRS